MGKDIREDRQSIFDQIKRTDEDGNEYWMARQLSKVFEYADFRNFTSVIEKAKEKCRNSGHLIEDHIVEVTEMVPIGSGAERSMPSYKLSRYACFLLVQNADSSKAAIPVARNYFTQQENPLPVISQGIIKSIYTIEGLQVILDKDLAELYQTDTRTLKQAVRRNMDRFPPDFMFELTDAQIDTMVSQFVIPSKSYFGGTKPFAFTEQGVAMLSAVLRTPIAVEVSLQIIRAFIEMRKLLNNHILLSFRLDRVERKQLETDQRLEQVFQALEGKSVKPDHGIFYKGEIYDAYSFVCDLIRSANSSIILIDNYIDDTVLTLLGKRNKGVEAIIYTPYKSKQLDLDLQKHNSQYPGLKIIPFSEAHDRFLIIDEKELYHFGASLKDLGKKWFAFSRMDSFVNDILIKLKRKDV